MVSLQLIKINRKTFLNAEKKKRVTMSNTKIFLRQIYYIALHNKISRVTNIKIS